MSGRTRSAGAGDQRGMTVVELMIAVVILGIVVAAAFSVSYSIMNNYREHRLAMGVERSARGAMAVLADAVRNASPGVPNGQIVDLVGCETWRGIQVEDASDGPDALNLVYSRGGQVTSLRVAFTETSSEMTVENASRLSAGDQILVTDFAFGHLMTIETITQAGLDWNLTLEGGTPQAMCPAPPEPFTYPVRAAVLRVRKARFSVDATGLWPVLMVDRDGAGGPLEEEPAAEGVEDLQIAIGVDRDGDGVIEEDGTSGNDDDWVGNHADDTALPDIAITPYRAIRLTVIGRSVGENTAVNTSRRPAAENRLEAAAPDVFRRRSLSTIVELRNLQGSP